MMQTYAIALSTLKKQIVLQEKRTGKLFITNFPAKLTLNVTRFFF